MVPPPTLCGPLQPSVKQGRGGVAAPSGAAQVSLGLLYV